MTTNSLVRGEWIPEESIESFKTWYPVDVVDENGLPVIFWRFVGEVLFNKPFFADTFMSLPSVHRKVCRTECNALNQFDDGTCLDPQAFIFHASRCGSTLLTQLLSILPSCIALSEPPAFDAALKWATRTEDGAMANGLLRNIVRILGQKRFDESHYFIKLDSWHINHLSFIREVFPQVPCYFFYRDPLAILASHKRQPGPQMVPDLIPTDMVGVPADTTHIQNLDAYFAKVLIRFFRSALNAAKSGHIVLVNYFQLPEYIWHTFLPSFSIDITASELETMQTRLTMHSKHLCQQFNAEESAGVDSVPLILMDEVEELYAKLENIRKDQTL